MVHCKAGKRDKNNISSTDENYDKKSISRDIDMLATRKPVFSRLPPPRAESCLWDSGILLQVAAAGKHLQA